MVLFDIREMQRVTKKNSKKKSRKTKNQIYYLWLIYTRICFILNSIFFFFRVRNSRRRIHSTYCVSRWCA